jgi:ketosteroid isomerase-like protein
MSPDVGDDETLAAVERFNDAFNRHDVDAVMAAMTDDCVFESTSPPLGERIVGHDAVRAFWDQFFTASPSSRFDAEEVIVVGDRCIVRWVHVWAGDAPGSVRGVDVITVRDGKVAEKLAYVKG